MNPYMLEDGWYLVATSVYQLMMTLRIPHGVLLEEHKTSSFCVDFIQESSVRWSGVTAQCNDKPHKSSDWKVDT